MFDRSRVPLSSIHERFYIDAGQINVAHEDNSIVIHPLVDHQLPPKAILQFHNFLMPKLRNGSFVVSRLIIFVGNNESTSTRSLSSSKQVREKINFTFLHSSFSSFASSFVIIYTTFSSSSFARSSSENRQKSAVKTKRATTCRAMLLNFS